MQTIGRRTFCGTAMMALPVLMLHALDKGNRPGQSDTVIDSLADEFTRITTDGAQYGFRAEHFRRYAGVVRTLDAHMEDKGGNAELNRRLDDDDYNKINPASMARVTTEFWNKHGIEFRESDLAAQYAMDPVMYREMKKAIKKHGGVRTLHANIAEAFERKAKEHETVAFKSGAEIHNGRVVLPPLRKSQRSELTLVQFLDEFTMFVGSNLDCLCKAMIVEGWILVTLCAVGMVELCPIAAFLLATEKLLESLNLCVPTRC